MEAGPATDSFANGDVVPIPTLPPSVASQVSLVTVNLVVVALAMVARPVNVCVPATERFPEIGVVGY